jgi:nucleoside-diphosphate-sugar epimerase
MNTLVTGGTGFIGAALVRALVSRGDRVRSLDNGSRGAVRRLGDAAGEVELVNGDIRDGATVAGAMQGIGRVVHLAYVNGTEHFYQRPELVLEVAVKGIVNVIDACISSGVGELVLASSSEVYQSPPRIPTDETAPLSVPDPHNPRYSYGGGKIISELMALNYGRRHIRRVLVFRPHNVYGPDMGWEHVVPQLALRVRTLARTSEGPVDLPIQGTGNETRAFVHIDDLVKGVLCVLDAGEHLGIYHVGSAEEVTIADLARRIGDCFSREVRVIPGDLREGSTSRRCPDISKLRALGFEPRVPLSAGLPPTVRWYDAHADERRAD